MSDRAIAEVTARGLYDSNGRAAVEVTVVDRAGREARSMAQRGSSVGEFEPVQVEDEGAQPRLAAVDPALRVVADRVAPALAGVDAASVVEVDRVLRELDTTTARRSVGGNVTVATSMAAAKLGALQRGVPLHEHLRTFASAGTPTTPLPAFNIVDGGLGPSSRVPHIEFLLFPVTGQDLRDVVEVGVRVRDRVRALCHAAGYEGADSQQGAVSAPLRSCEEGLDLLAAALVGLGVADGFKLGLDLAASDVWRDGAYAFPWADEPLTPAAVAERYRKWIAAYGLVYVEDGFAATETADFAALTAEVGGEVMIAGDDLYASNRDRITEGARARWSNTVVVKPNQAGTVTESLTAAGAARAANSSLVVSQRSGENEDSFLSSLAIAVNAAYVKVGGPSRMDRIMKVNELIRVLAP
ncbi:hypothetical protein ACFFQW_16505 [Umezawaea endophytica]|uniref:Enolase n=1 Tax=Umezawaea endophytica TaxID=1654476 RepID=A0A9X2VQJ7_9PSEU|nr:hypothetical protein [Umezawaea endophytica]MCS7480352.1 hypothetical protein [Umezawaea endophytica]